jgi:hypothetical protein
MNNKSLDTRTGLGTPMPSVHIRLTEDWEVDTLSQYWALMTINIHEKKVINFTNERTIVITSDCFRLIIKDRSSVLNSFFVSPTTVHVNTAITQLNSFHMPETGCGSPYNGKLTKWASDDYITCLSYPGPLQIHACISSLFKLQEWKTITIMK